MRTRKTNEAKLKKAPFGFILRGLTVCALTAAVGCASDKPTPRQRTETAKPPTQSTQTTTSKQEQNSPVDTNSTAPKDPNADVDKAHNGAPAEGLLGVAPVAPSEQNPTAQANSDGGVVAPDGVTSDTKPVAASPDAHDRSQPNNNDQNLLPAPPSVAVVPPRQTRLGAMFDTYLDQTKNLDEVERSAGDLVAEIFSEEEQIRPKIWEIQNLVKERYNSGQYNRESSEKVRILEAGLAEAAHNRDIYHIGRDAAIILGSSLALAVVGGYSDAGVVGRMVDYGKRGVEGVAGGIGATVKGTVSLFRPSTYKAAGERVEQYFASKFRPLTPRDRLLRNLERLGLDADEVAKIDGKILNVENMLDPQSLRKMKFYRTNMRSLKVSAVKSDDNIERFGYLIFRQSPARLSTSSKPTHYFQTDYMSEEEIKQLISKLYYGKDKREFVNYVSPDGTVTETRVLMDRFRDGITRARVAAANGVDSITQSVVTGFNMPRATQTFLLSNVLMGSGYALAMSQDRKFSDVYLESMIEAPVNESPTH